jgi:hypothetical protein
MAPLSDQEGAVLQVNDENDHDYFGCELVRETDSAYLVRLVRGSEGEHWVPKALCELGVASSTGAPYLLEVEAWFAKKEEMHG